MPKPGKNESKDKFMKRCIPMVLEEGTATDGSQAAAICHSLWKKHKDKGVSIDWTELFTKRPD